MNERMKEGTKGEGRKVRGEKRKGSTWEKKETRRKKMKYNAG